MRSISTVQDVTIAGVIRPDRVVQSDLPRRLIAATNIPAVAPVSTPRPGPSTRTAIPAPISAPCANSLTFRASAVDALSCHQGCCTNVQARPQIQFPTAFDHSIAFGVALSSSRSPSRIQPANGSTPHFADNVSATASSITPASSAFLSSSQPSASSAMNLSLSLALSASELANFAISISRL